MKKEHIYNFDFVRALCALLIVFYHIICMYETVPEWADFPLKSKGVNGDWGHIAIVAIFFMISGATLLYNYPEIKKGQLKKFYFKRWKSIFPAFYLVWLYGFLTSVVKTRTFFYAAKPKYLLLSIFGIDGYFNYLHPTYYNTGEWFLGAIIMLYLLYPFLLYCYRHFFKLSTVIILFLFFLNLKMDWFLIADADNLITCILSFWIGMIFTRYLNWIKENWILTGICGAVAIFLGVVPLNGNQLICMLILGIALFIILFNLGGFVYRTGFLTAFWNTTSRLSYEIFLVHHILIYYLFGYFGLPPVKTLSLAKQFFYIFIIFLFTFFFAKVVSLVIDSFFHSKFYLFIENKFLI